MHVSSDITKRVLLGANLNTLRIPIHVLLGVMEIHYVSQYMRC